MTAVLIPAAVWRWSRMAVLVALVACGDAAGAATPWRVVIIRNWDALYRVNVTREEGMREQLQGLLTTVGGLEVTPEVYDKWLSDLTVETGALPPIERVVEAIQLSNSIEAAKVGNAVRQLFRRPRPRPAGPAPANAAPRVHLAQ